MNPDTRAVWLTVEDFKLDAISLGILVQERFMTAPADPYEAAMRAWDNSAYPHTIIAAVLAALGFPASSRETHHE